MASVAKVYVRSTFCHKTLKFKFFDKSHGLRETAAQTLGKNDQSINLFFVSQLLSLIYDIIPVPDEHTAYYQQPSL